MAMCLDTSERCSARAARECGRGPEAGSTTRTLGHDLMRNRLPTEACVLVVPSTRSRDPTTFHKLILQVYV